MDFEPESIFAGKYRVVRELGRGGMGVVLLAHHMALDERVAIKILLPALAKDPALVGRFLREARAAVKVRGVHVARVTDVGSVGDGTPYMVMEYLEGEDLSEVLRRRGRLEATEAGDLVAQACLALHSAHANGIVHRDLKPSNLFLAREANGQEIVKVLDFGIAKILGSAGDSAVTATSALLGSPLYMSPEQLLSSKTVDARTDIWSLGVILFELMAGRPPFNADTMPQLCAKVMGEDAPSLLEYAEGAPSVVVAAVARCLDRKPDGRFASVRDLLHALGPALSPEVRAYVEATLNPSVGRASLPSLGAAPASPAVAPSAVALAAAAPLAPAVATTDADWSRSSSKTAPPSRRGTTLMVLGTAVAIAGVAALAWPPAARSGDPPGIPQSVPAAAPSPPASEPAASSLLPSTAVDVVGGVASTPSAAAPGPPASVSVAVRGVEPPAPRAVPPGPPARPAPPRLDVSRPVPPSRAAPPPDPPPEPPAGSFKDRGDRK